MVSARGLLRCFLKNIVAVTFRHHREELSHILVQWFALSHSRSDPELRAHLSTEHVNVSISAAGWSPHHPDVLGLWHISAAPISKWPFARVSPLRFRSCQFTGVAFSYLTYAPLFNSWQNAQIQTIRRNAECAPDEDDEMSWWNVITNAPMG